MAHLLALMAVLAGAGPGPSPLDGCRALPVGAGWQYGCNAFSATIEDHADAAAAREQLDRVVEGLMKEEGAGAVRRRERMRIAGREVEGVRLSVPRRRAGAYAAVLARPEGRRLVVCIAGADTARCAGILELLARQPWKATPLTLGGRVVPVPAGCRGEPASGGGRLRCAGTSRAEWAAAPSAAEGRRGAEDWDESAAQLLLKDGRAGAVRDTVPCRISGRETVCRRVRVRPGNAGAAVALSATAKVDDDILVVSCISPGSTGQAVPCSLVFEL